MTLVSILIDIHIAHEIAVVRIRPNEVTISDPADFREVYDTKTKYDKTKYFKRFALYGEDNLFSTEKYVDHQAKRRKIASAYTKSHVIANAESLVRERIAAFVGQVAAAPNGLVDVIVLFDCFSHDVMTGFLYGKSHGTHAIEDPADRPLVVNLKRSQIYTPIWVNFPRLHGSWLLNRMLGEEYERTGEDGGAVKQHIEKIMQKHDDDPNRDEDYSLYKTMRDAKPDADGRPMSREYMASEMYDHLKAGQQTTASTLTYMTWRLSRQPEWQKRLKDEIGALPVTETGQLSLADLEACSILNAIIHETLRLHPPASGRGERIVPTGGRTYSGVFVPGGTTIMGTNLVVQQNAAVFDEPFAWRPERWLDSSEEKLKDMEYSWVPFGYGARICIGQHLAMMEMRLLVSSIYRTYGTSLGEETSDESMHQLGTLAAVPRALRCELYMRESE